MQHRRATRRGDDTVFMIANVKLCESSTDAGQCSWESADTAWASGDASPCDSDDHPRRKRQLRCRSKYVCPLCTSRKSSCKKIMLSQWLIQSAGSCWSQYLPDETSDHFNDFVAGSFFELLFASQLRNHVFWKRDNPSILAFSDDDSAFACCPRKRREYMVALWDTQRTQNSIYFLARCRQAKSFEHFG